MHTYYFTSLLILLAKISPSVSVLSQFVRCTRRFSPGYCLGDVKPVWTFVFQYQNCVQRMGCPASTRVNRFATYPRCMRRCKQLMEAYSRLISEHEALLQAKTWESRRENIDVNLDNRTTEDFNDTQEYELMFPDSYLPDHTKRSDDLYEDIAPSDIDKVTEVHHMLDVFNEN